MGAHRSKLGRGLSSSAAAWGGRSLEVDSSAADAPAGIPSLADASRGTLGACAALAGGAAIGWLCAAQPAGGGVRAAHEQTARVGASENGGGGESAPAPELARALEPARGGAAPPASSNAGQLVATDRDAGAVVVLDADLIELRRFNVPYALEVELRADGRLWVVAASALGPLGPHTLLTLEPSGAVAAQTPIGPLLDLACLDGGAALLVVLRPDGQRDAVLHPTSGQTLQLGVGAAWASIAGQSNHVLVAGHDGSLASYSVGAATGLAAQRQFGGVIADVAPGPQRGTWYVLDVGGSPNQRRLAVLDAQLATLWSAPLGCGALHLCVSPDRQRVWLADGAAGFARRFGPNGALELAWATLPVLGCERGVVRADGSAVFAGPGALVRLASDGSVLPGQGGFTFLVDVAARRQL